MTDITEHPTREGKIYCCVVLDAFSRFVLGWSIDATQTTTLVLNARGMTIRRRTGQDGLVIHSDRGVQLTSGASARTCATPAWPRRWAPSTAPTTTRWSSRLQVELLNRQGWKTRIELATAIHDYIELFHNTRRRHSSLNMLTPTEFEDLHQHPINAG
jgi:transposase InsO family protein